MRRLMVGEGLKLLKMRALWGVIICAICFVGFIQYQSYVTQRGLYATVKTLEGELAQPGVTSCLNPDNPRAHCTTAQQADYAARIQAILKVDVPLLRAGREGLTPLGTIATTLGLFGTAIGLVLAAFIAALTMDIELREGGLKSLVLREWMRGRLFLAKVVGAFVAALASLGLTVVAMLLLVTILGQLRPIPYPGAAWGQLGLPPWWSIVTAAVVTPLLGISLTVFGSFFLGSSLGGIGTVVVALAVDRAIGILAPHAARFTIEGAISALTRGVGEPLIARAQVTAHIWPQFLGSGVNSPGAVGIVVGASAIVLSIGRRIFLVREYR